MLNHKGGLISHKMKYVSIYEYIYMYIYIEIYRHISALSSSMAAISLCNDIVDVSVLEMSADMMFPAPHLTRDFVRSWSAFFDSLGGGGVAST